jgi:hypothetical protein
MVAVATNPSNDRTDRRTLPMAGLPSGGEIAVRGDGNAGAQSTSRKKNAWRVISTGAAR